jgi:hypothetical protein
MHSFFENADPDLLEEVARLKSALKCRRYEEDVDFLLSDLDRPIFNQKQWPSPIVVASELVVETYYERGALAPLARIYKEHRWPVSGYIHDFVARATEAGRLDLVEQVWRGILQQSKRKFFESLPDRERYGRAAESDEVVDEPKQYALAAFDNLEAFYRAQENQAAEQIAAERAAFAKEEFRKPLPPPLTDKIDEAAFWRILADANADAGSLEEARARLISRLERLNAAGLRSVNSHYAKTMKRLYHWNVWALAYAACGGCSDDSFRDFRGWLILHGDPALIDLAIASPERAARRIPRDPSIPEGGLDGAIEAACLARTGNLPKALATDLAKPKGKAWGEDEIEIQYPDLVAYYARG